MLLRMLLQTLLDMLLDMLLLQMPLHMLLQMDLQMLLQMPLATITLGTLPDIPNNKILVPDEPPHATLVASPALTVIAAPPRCRLGCILPNGEGTRRRSVKKMNHEIDVPLVVARVVENPKQDVLWTTGQLSEQDQPDSGGDRLLRFFFKRLCAHGLLESSLFDLKD
ncbi:MAG: hypothetical protein Q9194_001901 [Teloschistes cf. exilis]